MDNKAHIESIADLASACRALGSPVRLRMVSLLCEEERYCGDLVKLFDLSQSTVSHHLKALKDAELVVSEERGTSTCYRVNRERLDQLKGALQELFAIHPLKG